MKSRNGDTGEHPRERKEDQVTFAGIWEWVVHRGKQVGTVAVALFALQTMATCVGTKIKERQNRDIAAAVKRAVEESERVQKARYDSLQQAIALNRRTTEQAHEPLHEHLDIMRDSLSAIRRDMARIAAVGLATLQVMCVQNPATLQYLGVSCSSYGITPKKRSDIRNRLFGDEALRGSGMTVTDSVRAMASRFLSGGRVGGVP